MSTLDDLAKKYKQPIFRPADTPEETLDRFPTGIATLDRTIGGGIPRGRLTQFYGDFSTLKTFTALLACSSALLREPKKQVIYFDFEYAVNPDYLNACGIPYDHPNFFIAQPDSPETAIKIAVEAINSGEISMVVFDSVTAMQPKAVLEASVEAAGIGVHAKMLGKACLQLTSVAAQHEVAVVFINQVRVNLSGYGSPEVRPGGKALDFYSDLIIRMGRSKIEDGKETIGATISVQVVKSKVCKPYTKTSFSMYYDSGVDFVGSFIELGVELGVVLKAGAWFSFGELKAQGVRNLSDAFSANPELFAQLKSEVLTHENYKIKSNIPQTESFYSNDR